jgi:hypothetical protein
VNYKGTHRQEASNAIIPSAGYKKWILRTILVVIAVSVLISLRACPREILPGSIATAVDNTAKPKATQVQTVTQSGQLQERVGTIEINTYDWGQPIICVEPEHTITSQVITPDVWCRVRYDGDNNRIYTNSPINWVKEEVNYRPNPAHKVEWQVIQGQSVTRATVAYAIKPN